MPWSRWGGQGFAAVQVSVGAALGRRPAHALKKIPMWGQIQRLEKGLPVEVPVGSIPVLDTAALHNQGSLHRLCSVRGSSVEKKQESAA